MDLRTAKDRAWFTNVQVRGLREGRGNTLATAQKHGFRLVACVSRPSETVYTGNGYGFTTKHEAAAWAPA